MYTLTRNCSLGDFDNCGCDDSRNGQLGKKQISCNLCVSPPGCLSTSPLEPGETASSLGPQWQKGSRKKVFQGCTLTWCKLA